MRILYICGDQGIPAFGRKGASTHMREMIAALRALGHEVVLAAADLSGDVRPEEDFPKVQLPLPKSRLLGKDGRYLAANFQARAVLLRAIEEHRIDALYERSALYFTAGHWAMERTGLPRILEVNSLLAEEQSGRLHFPALARRFEHKIIGRAPAVAAISAHMVRQLVRSLGRTNDNTRVYTMAVDPARFPPLADDGALRARLGWNAGHLVLGFVGSMNHYHRPDWFMDLAEKLHRRGQDNLRFLVVGGTPQKIERHRARLLRLAEEGVIHFAGTVPQLELGRWLATMDAVLVPGASPQSTPTKIFEAAAAGRPLLLPATEPIRELCGADAPYLFTHEDFAAFEAKVREFCEDPARFGPPAAALRERVVNHHTWEQHARSIVAWLGDLGRR